MFSVPSLVSGLAGRLLPVDTGARFGSFVRSEPVITTSVVNAVATALTALLPAPLRGLVAPLVTAVLGASVRQEVSPAPASGVVGAVEGATGTSVSS